jgi:murein L,D-transpeptidase YafK
MLILVGGLAILYAFGRPLWEPFFIHATGGKTVEEAVAQMGDNVGEQLSAAFTDKGLTFPPQRITLIALKREKILELWAEDGEKRTLVKTYPILAASGVDGPKLREGDLQVPEGIYRVTALNPNSAFHLSLKLDYPNDFDRAMAKEDGRTKLGGDIFIHGAASSIGCIAIGNPAIEELFYLVAEAVSEKPQVIIAPFDFRMTPPTASPEAPEWIKQLYGEIGSALICFGEWSGVKDCG